MDHTPAVVSYAQDFVSLDQAGGLGEKSRKVVLKIKRFGRLSSGRILRMLKHHLCVRLDI